MKKDCPTQVKHLKDVKASFEVIYAKYKKIGKKYKRLYGDTDSPLVLGTTGGLVVFLGCTAW